MALNSDILMTLLSGSQALAKHSRWLPTVLLEVGRQLGLFIPGIGGFVVLPPVGGERPVVDAFGAARAVGPAISAELLDQAVSGVWADGMTMPLKEAWGEGFAPGTRFVVAVPIKEGAECLGYIVAGLPDRESADAALTSMTLVGVLAGAHVANAQAHEADAVKLHYLAEHDTLVTDLPNRRLFRDRARNVLEQGSAALVFLDLDGFKEVNRDFGYAAGDEVLADVARRWRGIVERECPEATLARMGGDEFAVLLPGGEEERTKELARVLLLALREPAGGARVLRASAGISRAPADGDSVEALLRRAEEAMFSAKVAGGDRYAVAPQGEPSPGKRSTDG